MTEDAAADSLERSTDGPVRLLLFAVGMDLGGTERQILELIRTLPRHGIEVHLGLLEDGGELLEEARRIAREAQVPLKVFLRRGRFDPIPVLGIIKYIRRHRITHIHTFLSPATAAGLAAGWLARTPVRMGSIRSSRELPAGVFTRFLVALEDLLLRRTDAVVSNSMIGCEDGVGRGVSPERIHCIPNGFDPERLLRSQPKSLSGPGLIRSSPVELPESVRIVGMVGNFSAGKGQMTLVEAVLSLIPEMPDLHCVLLGDGAERTRVLELIAASGADDHFHAPGCVYPSVPWIRRFDVAVLLSGVREGCSNFIIEAMFLGKPVVCTAVGGNPEVVVDRVTGFVLRDGSTLEVVDALRKLLNDRELAASMGRAGQERAYANYHSDRLAHDMAKLYRDLVR